LIKSLGSLNNTAHSTLGLRVIQKKKEEKKKAPVLADLDQELGLDTVDDREQLRLL